MDAVFMRPQRNPFPPFPLKKAFYCPTQPRTLSRDEKQTFLSPVRPRPVKQPPQSHWDIQVMPELEREGEMSSSSSSRFNESWPSSDVSGQSVGGARGAESRGEPTLAKFIHRFRHAPPTSRTERESPSGEFWWRSPPTPQQTSPAGQPQNHSILTSPAGQPQNHSTPASSEKKSERPSRDFLSPRVSSLEERSQTLIDKSSSLLTSSTPSSLPAQKYLNTSHTLPQQDENPSPKPPSHRLGPRRPSLAPPLQELPLNAEDDILYQWRLRRRLEQARREASAVAQEGRIFLGRRGREQDCHDHSERQERVRDLYFHELPHRDGHHTTQTGLPTPESHMLDPQHLRSCANRTTRAQTQTLPCLPPSMQEDRTPGAAHHPHFQNFTKLVSPVLHHPHLHHCVEQVRPHIHASCDIVPCPCCDGRRGRRKTDKGVVDRGGPGSGCGLAGTSAGESNLEEAEPCKAYSSMTTVGVQQAELSSPCDAHSPEQDGGNVPYSHPPVEEQPDANVTAEPSRQDIAHPPNESSVPVTQAAVRYPSPSVLARCKKRKLPEANLSSIGAENQSELERGELSGESSQLSLTFSSDFDKTATPGRSGVMNASQREVGLSQCHEPHLHTNESFEDGGGPTQSSIGPVVCRAVERHLFGSPSPPPPPSPTHTSPLRGILTSKDFAGGCGSEPDILWEDDMVDELLKLLIAKAKLFERQMWEIDSLLSAMGSD